MRCTQGVCSFGRISVGSTGPVPSEYLLIGEAPGVQEIQTGFPFVGPAGKLLDKALEEAGLRRSLCRVVNTVRCVDLSREDRRPLPAEIDACLSLLLYEIRITDPAVIICLGAVSQSVFLPKVRISSARGKVRAWTHPQTGVVYPVVATYHPARALPNRNPEVFPMIVEDIILARGVTNVLPKVRRPVVLGQVGRGDTVPAVREEE